MQVKENKPILLVSCCLKSRQLQEKGKSLGEEFVAFNRKNSKLAFLEKFEKGEKSMYL